MAAQGAFGTDFYDRSILRPKHRAYYRSGRPPVIKIGPKGALGSHEIRPIHSAPSLGQSIHSPFDNEVFEEVHSNSRLYFPIFESETVVTSRNSSNCKPIPQSPIQVLNLAPKTAPSRTIDSKTSGKKQDMSRGCPCDMKLVLSYTASFKIWSWESCILHQHGKIYAKNCRKLLIENWNVIDLTKCLL